MATEVARITAVLEADTRKFERGVLDARRDLDRLDNSTATLTRSQGRLDKQILGTGLTMRNVFAGVAGTVAVGFMKDAVKAASDLNESINAVNVTFGDAAEGILKLGENAAESVGLANSEFNTLAVSFSNFVTTAVGEGGDVAAEMEKLTTRVADFASVMNLEVPEAAQKFQSALAGETESMRRFGIDVSAAAVKAKGLELGLGDATGAMTEQEKVIARLAILYEETDKFAGDFANTQDELANKTRVLNARLEDMKAEIGEALVPVWVNLLEAIEPAVGLISDAAGAVNEFRSEAQQLKAQGNPFEQFLGGLMDILTSGALPGLISQIKQLLGLSGDLKRITGGGTRRSTSSSTTVSAPRPVLSSVGPRHFGGPLAAGQPSIVGEGGPEMFVPQTSGTVVNLSQHFQRAEGANLDADISRGILLSGIGRFIESSPR